MTNLIILPFFVLLVLLTGLIFFYLKRKNYIFKKVNYYKIMDIKVIINIIQCVIIGFIIKIFIIPDLHIIFSIIIPFIFEIVFDNNLIMLTGDKDLGTSRGESSTGSSSRNTGKKSLSLDELKEHGSEEKKKIQELTDKSLKAFDGFLGKYMYECTDRTNAGVRALIALIEREKTSVIPLETRLKEGANKEQVESFLKDKALSLKAIRSHQARMMDLVYQDRKSFYTENDNKNSLKLLEKSYSSLKEDFVKFGELEKRFSNKSNKGTLALLDTLGKENELSKKK